MENKEANFNALNTSLSKEAIRDLFNNGLKDLDTLSPLSIQSYPTGEEYGDKEGAQTAWKNDMIQQEESMRLQLASLKLVAFEEEEEEKISHKSSSVTPIRIMGIDDIRQRVMTLFSQKTRFTIFMLLKTLHETLDIVSLVTEQDEMHYRLVLEVLRETPLTSKQQKSIIKTFSPFIIQFDVPTCDDVSYTYRLVVTIEKNEYIK